MLKFNPILSGGGAPLRSFFYRSSYRRRLQIYSKFKFCHYVTSKFGLVSEKIFLRPVRGPQIEKGTSFFASFGLEMNNNFISLKLD